MITAVNIHLFISVGSIVPDFPPNSVDIQLAFEKPTSHSFSPLSKRESMVQKYNSILAAKQRSTCSAPTLVAPVGNSQSSSVTIAMSFHSPLVSSDSSFEEKMMVSFIITFLWKKA